jgi:hypothetical protein
MDTLALKRITVDRQGDVAVVTFVDRNILDEQQISVLGDEYYLLVHQFTKVLLDFSHVGYHSSGAFGKLIGLERLTRHSNIPLRLKLLRLQPWINSFIFTGIRKRRSETGSKGTWQLVCPLRLSSPQAHLEAI